MRMTDYTKHMLIETIRMDIFIFKFREYDFHIDTEFMNLFEIIVYD